jgi:hypothetical protein
MARTAIMILLTAAALVAAADGVSTYTGQIVDSATKRPIAAATVTVGTTTARTGADGVFRIEATLTEAILVRAWGYRRAQVSASAHTPGMRKIELAPFRPKALYLSVFGIGSQALREPAVRLIQATELNALVIDVKGDRGLIPYRTSVSWAAQAGANRIITVKDIQKLVADLHTRGLYLIARIVVFKDDPLASARPDLAVKSSATKSGATARACGGQIPARKRLGTTTLISLWRRPGAGSMKFSSTTCGSRTLSVSRSVFPTMKRTACVPSRNSSKRRAGGLCHTTSSLRPTFSAMSAGI